MMTCVEGGRTRRVVATEESRELKKFRELRDRLENLNEVLKREEEASVGLTDASIALERRAEELNGEMFRLAHKILGSETDGPVTLAAKARVALFYAEAESDDIVHQATRELARSILLWLSGCKE
jgi:cell division septum initiation protein DivIVA